MVLTFVSFDKIVWWEHLNEISSVVPVVMVATIGSNQSEREKVNRGIGE